MKIQYALFISLSLIGMASTSFAANTAKTTPASSAAQSEDIKKQLREYYFDAARTGNTKMLNEFIQAGYNLNSQDEKGYTALILAAYHGHKAMVDQLLKAGANACVQDKTGNTALMGAIFKGELKIAKTLMQTECSPDQKNNAGQTASMYAALFQRKEVLDSLVKQGANTQLKDARGNSVDNLSRGEFK
ncbi:ankyrin repeat domain-containing protein [Acinetobacter apis]|uniref:Uncharacterized protein n=1 Tax=Acinetobacter apis TaxID=1229165 RepID=A0A217EHJ8_9GAMM|nr:ankyrin repeat domain-containing protein [Acinetobacter apis]SNQ29660.1 hypothetical protein SAMN05444584_1621 [Acinetobacter apis]